MFPFQTHVFPFQELVFPFQEVVFRAQKPVSLVQETGSSRSRGGGTVLAACLAMLPGQSGLRCVFPGGNSSARTGDTPG
ncbi:hypothetical protein Atai01_04220 [Amycolatopsis taiwanensis]|uniref:Uncharacterized protein n=1 Tax=Amycolatopsis taiwanensis TaxID=342230 RepID=A0A9W6VAI1_9PSEU|nr:hypothetical protein Atai01_04220 [Amycolatopsis taiwanensis]